MNKIWRRMNRKKIPAAEQLLHDRENRYVAACGRFLKRRSTKGRVWTLLDADDKIHALMVYSRRTLLPVLCGGTDIPDPVFLKRFFGMIPIHSVQGLVHEVMFVENYLSRCGLEAVDIIDYDLMYIDAAPAADCCRTGPANLILREAQKSDLDALAVLQAGYEQEEVLPRGSVFYPAVSRLNTEKIFTSEQILVAELDGYLVGKINTSALTYTRFQVGGVFVHPDYRGRGIAQRMTAEFTRMLIGQGRGVTLFVKKLNPAAQKVYRRLGFSFLADYRITYY